MFMLDPFAEDCESGIEETLFEGEEIRDAKNKSSQEILRRETDVGTEDSSKIDRWSNLRVPVYQT